MTRTERPPQHPMVSWDAAMRISAAAAHRLGSEPVALADAVGRVIADDIRAVRPIPHYTSSAMDGWAVAGQPPWQVHPAGAPPLASGTAQPIVTGGDVPAGADAVVRTEDAVVSGGLLQLRPGVAPPRAGADIRPAGDEATAGEVVIGAGTVLNPAHAALAAACGNDRVNVVTRPRVRLLLTGDEVDTSGLPGAGRVRDSFGPMLPATVTELGGVVTGVHRVADGLDAMVRAFGETSDAELIVTTGGTGGSNVDHLRAAIAGLGAELLVPRIAVRPGAPTLFARLPDGRLVAGLAGNPLAAVIGLLLVAAPALAVGSGRPVPTTVDVVASVRIPGRGDATSMVPYGLVPGGIAPSPWIGSGMLRGLAQSAGIAIVPAEGVDAGSPVPGLALPWSRPRSPASG